MRIYKEPDFNDRVFKPIFSRIGRQREVLRLKPDNNITGLEQIRIKEQEGGIGKGIEQNPINS